MAVIGAKSMVGSRFCELASDEFNLTAADLSGEAAVDITNFQSVEDFFKDSKFAWIILFSAFTDVNEAEKQRNDKDGSCWQVNVEGAKNIVMACQKYQRSLLFISTDFVFDGQNGPYSESCQPGGNLDRISWYGLTKIEAEKIIRSQAPSFTILRIAYPYRAKFEGKDDIAKTIIRLYGQGDLYPLFTDQTITPTFIDDLAPAIKLLISSDRSGIFHVASPTLTSPYDFARVLISTFGDNPDSIEKGLLAEVLKKPGSTPRPLKGGLDVEKIKGLGFEPTGWREGIKIIFNQSAGKLI